MTDITEKLIELVKDKSYLYDLKHSLYKNIIVKEKTWEDIGKELNLSVEICKIKWKGLRDSYRRERKRELHSPSGSEAKSKRPWKYYEQLQFLNDVESSRILITNVDSVIPEAILVENVNSSESILDNIFSTSDTQRVDDPISCNTSSSSSKPKTPRKRRFEEILEVVFNSIRDIVSMNHQEPKSSTEMLFSALAKKLDESTIPPDEKEEVEWQISSIVYETLKKYRKDI